MADISFLPPGLRGYVAGQQQNQAADAQNIQSLTGLLGLQSQLQLQPLKLQQLQMLVDKSKMDMALQQQLMSGGGLSGNMGPDQVEALGTRLSLMGHSSGAPLLNLADKLRQRQQDQSTVATMRSAPPVPGTPAIPAPPEEAGGGPGYPQRPPTPGAPGAFGALAASYPMLAPQANAMQALIDRPGSNITGANALAQLQHLGGLGTAQQGLYERAGNAQQAQADRANQAQLDRENNLRVAASLRPPSAPSITTIQDPNDPSKNIVVDAKTGKTIGNAPKDRNVVSPMADRLYKEYAAQPQVKDANDLEAKMKPVADYMVDFKKTGKSVNVNDESLVKLYLSATTGSNRSYNVDRKALAALPNVGDRFGNAISSFATGHDLTDQTRTELFNYVVQRYKALDSARQGVKASTLARAKANMVPPEQVFGAEQ